MKKVLFLGVCALFGLTAAAQQSVVKDAERAMKKEANYAEVLKIITPAMSNPETQNDVQVYFIPGKTGFKQYDDIFALKQFGKAPEGAEKIMSLAILGGYDNFMKALPLDSVPDAKGKVKPSIQKKCSTPSPATSTISTTPPLNSGTSKTTATPTAAGIST